MVTLCIANEEKVMLIHTGEASVAPQTSSSMTVEDQILADNEALEPEHTLVVEEEGSLENDEVWEDDRVVVERQSRYSTDGRYGRLCITPTRQSSSLAVLSLVMPLDWGARIITSRSTQTIRISFAQVSRFMNSTK